MVEVGAVDVEVGPVDVEGEAVDVEVGPVDVEVGPVDVEGEAVDVELGPVDVEGEAVDVELGPVDVEAVDVGGVEAGRGEQVGVEVEVGGAVFEVDGMGVGPTTVVRGFGRIMMIGVKPGWWEAGFAARLAATRIAPAERVGAGLEAGSAEAGRAVTPWRYASAMAVTVLA